MREAVVMCFALAVADVGERGGRHTAVQVADDQLRRRVYIGSGLDHSFAEYDLRSFSTPTRDSCGRQVF